MSVSVILASSSSIRKEILSRAGIEFRVVRPCIDESHAKGLMRADMVPAGEQAMRLAEIKAVTVSGSHSGLVIGADQVLDLGDEVLDKPANLEVAGDHLRKLSGRTHTLATAISVVENGETVWQHLSCPRLTMRTLTDEFVRDYIDRCGSALLSTVGAYQLEGTGIQLFSRIDGDFFSILGLPVLPLLDYLRVRGVIME